jgi:uncharacterized protein YcfL
VLINLEKKGVTVHSIFGLIVLILMFGGCATKEKLKPPPIASKVVCIEVNSSETYSSSLPQEEEGVPSQFVSTLSDLEYYPQSINVYLQNNFLMHNNSTIRQSNFEQQYYSPWCYRAPPASVKEVQWPINAYKRGYGSNLNPHASEWFKELEVQSNIEAFGSVNKSAIANRWLDLRLMPTLKPLYRNPALAGEGYPFDYFQNSSVSSNEPLFVSHYSKDGAWVYVFSNSASGWVQSNGITVLTSEQTALLQKSQKLFITEDKTPLYDSHGVFVLYSRIGMVLSLQEESDVAYKAYYVDREGLTTLVIPKSTASLGIQGLTQEGLQKVAAYMLQNTYGWGGMFQERDCSSMIRDMFTPFGLWLPRNSLMQAKKGEIISLKGLDNVQKIALIKEKGVPFETILYKKGHVMLYVGTYNGTVAVMHNIWGIRTSDATGKKGRVVVGKAVISSLELGREVKDFDSTSMLLTTLESMNIITAGPASQPLLVKSSKP